MFRRPDPRPDKAITFDEYRELQTFCDNELPHLGEQIREVINKHGMTDRVMELLRLAFEDMQIAKAGGLPKNYRFPPHRIGTFEMTEKQ